MKAAGGWIVALLLVVLYAQTCAESEDAGLAVSVAEARVADLVGDTVRLRAGVDSLRTEVTEARLALDVSLARIDQRRESAERDRRDATADAERLRGELRTALTDPSHQAALDSLSDAHDAQVAALARALAAADDEIRLLRAERGPMIALVERQDTLLHTLALTLQAKDEIIAAQRGQLSAARKREAATIGAAMLAVLAALVFG